MKSITFLLLLINPCLIAQKNKDAKIKRLEQLEVKGIHAADTTSLVKIWHPHFGVNNPSWSNCYCPGNSPIHS